jgi:ADP-ribosylglycohydrolase
MNPTIEDRVYGCLIGGAVGDALGAPVEGWSHRRINEEYGTLETFKQYYMPYSNTQPGAITSDTALRQYLSLAMVEADGRVTPREFASVLTEDLNEDRVWINGEIVLRKLSAGLDPWGAGEGTVPDNKMTGAITPIGLVNPGDPVQAYQDGFTIAGVFQETHDRHASATVAAGVAAAIARGATIESVLATMFERSEGVLTRAIDLAMGYAEASENVDELVETLYETFLDWQWPASQWDREKYYQGKVFSASTLEVVPVAMAILHACDGQPNRSIIEGVNFGRDSDSIATLAGSIAGTLHGASAIREEWKSKCEAVNQDFFEELEGSPDATFRSMASRIVECIRAEQMRHRERADELDQLLGEATEEG